jgi:hypothetical protein
MIRLYKIYGYSLIMVFESENRTEMLAFIDSNREDIKDYYYIVERNRIHKITDFLLECLASTAAEVLGTTYQPSAIRAQF